MVGTLFNVPQKNLLKSLNKKVNHLKLALKNKKSIGLYTFSSIKSNGFFYTNQTKIPCSQSTLKNSGYAISQNKYLNALE